eukprot:6404814-Amphidinium_carterae.1
MCAFAFTSVCASESITTSIAARLMLMQSASCAKHLNDDRLPGFLNQGTIIEDFPLCRCLDLSERLTCKGLGKLACRVQRGACFTFVPGQCRLQRLQCSDEFPASVQNRSPPIRRSWAEAPQIHTVLKRPLDSVSRFLGNACAPDDNQFLTACHCTYFFVSNL